MGRRCKKPSALEFVKQRYVAEISDDIIVLVLLQHLHIVENIVPGTKSLDKPRARIGAIAKDLALNRHLVRSRDGDKIFLRHFRMRRKRIV